MISSLTVACVASRTTVREDEAAPEAVPQRGMACCFFGCASQANQQMQVLWRSLTAAANHIRSSDMHMSTEWAVKSSCFQNTTSRGIWLGISNSLMKHILQHLTPALTKHVSLVALGPFVRGSAAHAIPNYFDARASTFLRIARRIRYLSHTSRPSYLLRHYPSLPRAHPPSPCRNPRTNTTSHHQSFLLSFKSRTLCLP